MDVTALSGQGTGRQTLRFAPVIITMAVLLLIGLSLVIGVIVRDSMRGLTRGSLRSVLSANVAVLEMWLAERRSDVSGLQEIDRINTAAHELLGKYAQQPDEFLAVVQDTQAYQSMSRDLAVDSYLGWALLDDQSMVVASSVHSLTGQTLAVPHDAWRRLAQRSTTVSRPFKSPVPLTAQGPHSRPGAPLMCAMAPIVDGGRTVGILALLIDPQARFTRLLSVAPIGDTGHSYAFDHAGTLISQTRFDHQLRICGLLDSDPLVTSALNIAVRDPGVNLTTGATTSVPRDQQPLTAMADQATRGGAGDNLLGYNDYRGVPVIGAWQWLPDYEIGVTTEMAVAEAYRPMRILQQSFLGLVSLIALSGLGCLIFPAVFQRFKARFQVGARAVRRLGQYDLGDLVGRGGMGAVYRGKHRLLSREVAIKVLEGDEVNPQSISRFEREVKMTARLCHPNTIDIYDYGKTDDSTFYYAMEFVDGITLQELVDEFGPQPPARVIHLLLQICGSLSEAHRLGMIHRDVKPSNILVTASAGLYDVIKVLDFGLVKEVNRDTVELTQADGITGSPMYMSPEAVRDAATANQQSDLYSVGAVGYALLTGLPAFEGESSVDVCLKQLNEEPRRPCDRIGQPLPDDLQNVLMSCLRKEPQERPLSIDDLESALRQCADAGRWSAADALRWWEMELPAPAETAIHEDNVGKIGTGNDSSRTRAQ